MSEMIDISKLKTWDKPHKVFIPSKYGVFVKRADLEKLLETAHNSDYAKCTAEVLDYIHYSIGSKAGRDIQNIIKKHFVYSQNFI